MTPELREVIESICGVMETLNTGIAELQAQVAELKAEGAKLAERVDYLENKSSGFHDSYL